MLQEDQTLEQLQKTYCHCVCTEGGKKEISYGIEEKRPKENLTPRDRRGTNPKLNAIPEQENILLREHIQSFSIKTTQ